MNLVPEGTLLWTPSARVKEAAAITRYMRWLEQRRGLAFADYDQLWEWSVTDLEAFWASIWDFTGVQASQTYTRVLGAWQMPGARWFEGARLNYAENVFRNMTTDYPAVIFQSETHPVQEISWRELHDQTAAVASALRNMGVGPGDRVVAYMPNVPATVVAFLACASIGAIWSSCSPDFGSPSVIDRFKQIEPKLLFAVEGYSYGGKVYDKRSVVRDLQAALPTLEHTVLVPHVTSPPHTTSHTKGHLSGTVVWDDLLRHKGGLEFAQVPFDHPLWVLYSSGTTGLPKPIVQGHGGILLEHLKKLILHNDLGPGDRLFWYTTTGWMMWNFVVGGLLGGVTIVLYDGSPGYPDMNVLWQMAADAGFTCFGTSAAYITACMKAGLEPGTQHDLSALRSLGSTGSPLPPAGFDWVYKHVKSDLMLASVSGGTDVCTAFVGCSPLLPVYAGEIQCRCLGAKVEAFTESGESVVDEVGELVITEPMPSMPLYFWNDVGNQRYTESYFEMFPGVWRHGDWIKITPRGGCVIYGRSDSTINRQGVRMGTSEIYQAVEVLPEIADSLVIDLEGLDRESFMPLFVVLQEGAVLDDTLRAKLKQALRDQVSPRHVPDAIYTVSEIPRTLNGKKLEVPVRKILTGVPPEKAASPDSMNNPAALDFFVELAEELNR